MLAALAGGGVRSRVRGRGRLRPRATGCALSARGAGRRAGGGVSAAPRRGAGPREKTFGLRLIVKNSLESCACHGACVSCV